MPSPRSRTPLAAQAITPSPPHCLQHNGDPGQRTAAPWVTRHSMLLATATGHQAPLAMTTLIIVILLIGALLAIVLVSLARRDDRVDAIHAAAEVLRAFLPWPSHRQATQDSRNRPPDH